MDVCLHNLPVLITLDRAGVTGNDGPSHHGVFDLSFARMAPNLTVMAPADENELRHMLFTALTEVRGPCVLRFPKGAVVGAQLEPMRVLPVGQWSLDGEIEPGAVLVIGTGRTVAPAFEAAKRLRKEGTPAVGVNARYVKPMDPRLAVWAKGASLVATVEDNVTTGGFGSGVAEALGAAGVTTPHIFLGVPDRFLDHAGVDEIHAVLSLDAEGIVARIANALASLPQG
jgi:1-deoxy-D-xylulose-5-phosphate synthase